MVHACKIKYINPEKKEGCCELKDFEVFSHDIKHDSFEELCAEVEKHCPDNAECVQPIAFYHEVMWAGGSSLDVLHHAIEAAEYECLCWDTHRTLCVDIVPKRTSFGRRFEGRLADPK